jgi:NAD dependent epimerase/dehydratase family enzyme
MPAGLPTPRWLLELGAVMIRTETELVLKSRWVGAEKLMRSGFAFRYPNLDAALASIVGLTPDPAVPRA